MSSVTVEINGKETVSQAAQQAGKSARALTDDTKNLSKETGGLSSQTSALDGIFGGFVITAGDVVNAIQAIAKAAYSTVQAFAEQERSVQQFQAAVALSGRITNEGADSLRQYAEEIGLLTGADDEAIMSMEAFLIAAGRNEEQTRKLIRVAADYSAATGKDMRTAVEELNKTFSGSEGRIGQLIPALKDLTDEQLKAGAGVDAVAKQYGGLAAQMSDIADVKIKNLKLAWDDVLAAIGAEVYPMIEPALESATKFIREKLIPGIGDFFDVTVAIFKNIPDVAKRSFTLILEIIRRTFSWDGISAILGALGQNIANAFASAFSVIPYMFLNILNLLFTPVKEFGLYIADTIKKAFSGKAAEIQAPGDLFANIAEAQVGIVGDIAKEAAGLFSDRFHSSVTIAAETGEELYSGLWSRYIDDINTIIKPTLDEIKTSGSGAGGSGGSGSSASDGWVWNPQTGQPEVRVSFMDGLSVDFDKIVEEWGADARRETSEREKLWARQERGLEVIFGGLESALGEIWKDVEPIVGATSGEQSHASGGPLAVEVAAYGPIERSGIAGFGFAGAGQVSANAPDLSWLQQLGSFLEPVVKGFMGLIMPLSSVTQILDPLKTIFAAMMDVLGPLINTILAPIVGILRIVGTVLGQMLAPIISALGPVIQLISDAFIWLYNNAIMPFANFVIRIGNILYNAVVDVYNWINNLWGGADLARKAAEDGFLVKIDASDLAAAGATTATTTTGASATYERPRDITVNVEVNTSALVGDDGISQFALIIGRELKAAGVLGVA